MARQLALLPYWEMRAVERMTAAERASLPYLAQIQDLYDNARRKTVDSVRRMYGAYYSDKGWDTKALYSIAPSGDIRRSQTEMRELGLSTRLPANYRGRMSRLEMMNAQMWAESQKAALKHQNLETKSHVKTIAHGYNRTVYDISKGIGFTPAFTQLNTGTLNQILTTRFKGQNYSQRVWGNTNKLANSLTNTLGTAIATGQSPEKTIREIRERFDVTKSEAARLVRTETNFFENRAELEAYESMGIEKYAFSATLDAKTSIICREHDGKVYDVKEAMQGDNAPPLHPNCRSTIVPHIDGWRPQTRIARDPFTGRNEYVKNMTYEQWAVGVGIPDAFTILKDGSVLITTRPKGLINEPLMRSEAFIRANSYETMLIYDEKDKVVDALIGTRHSVSIDRKAHDLLATGKYGVSHNHPTGGSFSLQDLLTSSDFNLPSLRAIGKNWAYTMKPNGKWPKRVDIRAAYDKNHKLFIEPLRTRSMDGMRVTDQMLLTARNKMMDGVAKDLGLTYIRSRM